jgi:cell division transport system permease protein
MRKQAPLLPPDSEYDGPLFFVIAIIVFLASLATISAFMAMQNVNHWKQALRSEMTVQIKSGNVVEAGRAVQRLQGMDGVKTAILASREDAKALLEPWLGADNIPDDMPIPLLIYVKLDRKNPPDAAQVAKRLSGIGIDASVDDHQRWARDLARSARAVQVLSISVLSLLVTASIAITGFATRSGLAARRDLVNVLHRVGAKDRVIAQLFGRRFVMLGLKAGAMGSMLAALSLGVLWLSGIGDATFSASVVRPGFGHLGLLIPVPMITAAVGGWTAFSSVMKNLRMRT